MIKRSVLSILCLIGLTLSAPSAAETNLADEQVSDAFVRSAVVFMTYSQALDSDEPFVLAGTLLDAALELNPGNAQAWAMRAELAETAGDQDAYEKALVGYLDTGINDDQAKFNLIRFRLSKNNNTLDAQLRSVEKLLNSDAGRALSGPLRSRLASFASSVANELLDERARRKWAVEAARSDPGNLEAAQVMLSLVTELGGDTVRRGTATVNVIRADPLSPQPRLELAAMLAESAAFERAAQQYQVVSTRLSAQPLHLSAYVNWAQCLAMTGNDELALQLIDEFEKALNPEPPAEEGDAQPPAEGEDPADEEDELEPVDLPIGLELVRLALLDGEDQKQQAQEVFDGIARRLQAEPEAGDGEDKTENDNANNLAIIAAVFGPNLDQAKELAKANDNNPVALGWVALRKGDFEEARRLLGPVANEKPVASCGLAIATGTDDAGRARLLQEFLESSSSASIAALAAGRYMLKVQTPAQPTTTGKALAALMAKYPEAFWQVDLERTPWLEVRMKVKPQRVLPLKPINAEITLWNTSRFPLAISENGPIREKAVITLNAVSSGRMLPPSPPIVVDLGRAFTLKASERMIIDTKLGYHEFGTLRATNPGVPFSLDARIIVNPTLTPGGTWVPSDIGSVSDVRNILVQSKPTAEQDIDRWIEDLGEETPAKRLQAIMRLASLKQGARPGTVKPELLEQAKAPLQEAWGKANAIERAWLLLNTTDLGQPTASYPDLLDLATASESKQVWLALLVSQASEVDSPILTAGIGRQDMPEVSRFAERQRRLLKDYAKFLEEQENQPAPAE